MTAPEAWKETCLINLNDGTTDMNISPIMTSLEINQGGKPVKSVPTLSGGRIMLFDPEEDTEINFEGIPVSIGDKDATSQDGLELFFHGGTSSAAPFTASSSTTRTAFVVTIMWTDGTATSATSSVLSGNYALRYNFANAYMVTSQPSFSVDGGLVAKYSFKCAPRNKAGTSNITEQSTDGTASLATI